MTSPYTYSSILRLLWRYLFALGLVGVCVLLCLGIPNVMAPRPFLAFWPVVVVAAEFGGIGPGLFATVASMLCVHFILNPVLGGLNLFDWIGTTTAGIFFVGASAISIFIGRKRNLQSIQRLQAAAMESATNGIALTDVQGVLLWVNPAFCAMTGYASGEIVGKNYWLLDGENQNEAFYKNIWSTVLQREAWCGELVARRKNGTTYMEERSVTPVTDADGRIIHCVIIMQDITERDRAEKSLRESEHEFRLLAESMPQIVWSTRPDGWNIYFNPQWVDYTGQTMEESYGHGWNKPFHPEDQQRAFDAWQNAVNNMGVYSLECRLRRFDGIYKWFLIRGVPVLGDDGTILKWYGTCTDIDEFKKSEEALHKFVMLADSSSEFIGMCDLDFKPLYVNPAGCRMVGLPDIAAACQARVQEYFFPDDQRFITEEFFPRVLREGSGEVEIRLRHFQTGEPIWVFYYLYSVRNASGEIIGWATVSHNITERRQAEEEKAKLESQLHQAQKMESIGRLAGGVAHDFNNMLTVILGHAQLGLMHLEPNNPVCANFMEISKTAERSANLTRQLLAFARKQTIAPKVLDLNDTTTDMLNMLQRLIGEDIHLKWHPATTLWQVNMDPSQIDQLLANLCVNARDAIKDTGKITIETANSVFDRDYCEENPGFVPGDFVTLAVSDDGCGMDKETQALIFEPFFTTKALGEGTGLGLATVYGIVKQNNGFIKVYSEPDQGTTFKIYLPHHVGDDGHVPKLKEASAPLLTNGQETILLVEDEAGILNMTKTLLEKYGYTVLAASKPSEAIALAKEYAGQIGLLMTDVVMPEMNGRELSNTLSELRPELRCLFMSGYTANVIAHHGVLDKGVNFIAKPFSAQELATKVREALDGPLEDRNL